MFVCELNVNQAADALLMHKWLELNIHLEVCEVCAHRSALAHISQSKKNLVAPN